MRAAAALEPLLAAYLFGEAGAARAVCSAGDAARLALGWLYRFIARWEWEHARSRSDRRDGPRGADLSRAAEQMIGDLRMAMALGDDRAAVHTSSASGDALRVMTIHASKGLEFHSVFVPGLNAGSFPPRARTRFIAEPRLGETTETDAVSEEARLLYVALSRARSVVTVSRSLRSSGRNTRPSRLWEWVSEAMMDVGGERLEWPATATADALNREETRAIAPEPLRLSLADVEQYDICPRRYAFDNDHAGDDRPVSPYMAYALATRLAVRIALASGFRSEAEAVGEAMNGYDAEWARLRPAPIAVSLYRGLAQTCIRTALRDPEMRRGDANVRLAVEIADATISTFADRVAFADDGSVVLERLKFGRPPKHSHAWPGAAVLRLAALERWPQSRPTIALRYLLSGALVPVETDAAKDRAAVSRFENAVNRLREGHTEPRPSEQCPWCPYVFGCSRGRGAE